MTRPAKSKKSAKPVPEICGRLAKARDATRRTQDEVAVHLGVHRDTYSKWENRTPMPTDQIPAAARFLSVSETWLAWGENMPAPKNSKRSGDGDQIPEIEVRAGLGEGEEDVVEIPSGQWNTPTRFFGMPDQLMIVDSKGDSMEPTLVAGDRLVIDRRDKNPSQGGIYAIWDGYGLRVKRVETLARSKPWRIRILSENPIYPADEMEVDDNTIVGRVVGIIRRLR